MADAMTVGGALSATKAAFDLTKAFVDVRDAAKVQAVKFELMGLLLEAQEAQAALIAEKRDLEERVRELEAWRGEKERYELASVGDGTFAYTLKAHAQGTEPAHMACANCFDHGKRRILQQKGYPFDGSAIFICPDCSAQIVARSVVQAARVQRAPGNPCPSCGAYEFRVSKSESHKGFGEMGGKNVTSKCGGCGFEDVELVIPKG